MPTHPHILVVEDHKDLGQQIKQHLLDAGYQVTWIKTGTEAINQDPTVYAMVVLDLMLPGRHGFDVLKVFRRKSDTPIMILSARRDTSDKVRGLKLGADDYLTKPFWPEELVARVATHLRRPSLQRDDMITVGAIRLDLNARKVIVDDRELTLTVAEFTLIEALAKRPGQAITRAQLAGKVLDDERDAMERTLDTHVSRLRKKLGSASGQLKTVWGIGYRLEQSEEV